MQDIRKPYTRSRSSTDLEARLERFQDSSSRGSYYDEEPVRIPTRGASPHTHDMDVHYRRPYEAQDTERFYARDEAPERHKRARRKISYRSALSLLAGVGILSGALLYTFVFNSATITVVPKFKDIKDFSRVVVFSKDATVEDSVTFTEETKSITKTKTLKKSETRKVESKASGKAIIYNNYDANPQKLIKNTRFESEDGKIYRINDSVTVPGKTGDTPGSVEVTLYADSTGGDYNVTSTKFTIPGFKNSPRYSLFYAKTSTPITGGMSGTKSLASLSDINAAKDSLAIELEKQLKEEMKDTKKEGYLPILSNIEVTFVDNEDEVLKGSTDEYKVTATGHLMLVDISLLARALALTLATGYDKEPVTLGNADDMTFTLKASASLANATSLPILVEGSPRIIWDVDEKAIKTLILGQDRDNFKTLMKSISSIESASLTFSPMWLGSFPNEEEKIKVEESLPRR